MTSRPSGLPAGVVTVPDYEPLARAVMTENAWAYISGGGADELTMRWNREAFDRIRLSGRVLADLSSAHTRISLLGQELDYPILLAPAAYQRLVHPDGELATIEAASAMKALTVVSTEASVSLEDLAARATGPLWFQLYVQHDRGFTEELINRASSAGYRALVVTVDAPINGVRDRERRAGFHLPAGVERANLRGLPSIDDVVPSLLDSPLFGGPVRQAATWRDIEWLISIADMPVLLKGILNPDDARLAMKSGAAGVVVSNHGGRTLDTWPASVDALPAVAEAVDGQGVVLMDGGIRRGTDVLKALALGANAVLIGRPYVYGLAVAGAMGVAHVLHLLRAELEVAMALTGCATIADIDRRALYP
jgi:4-hydroxymandelate oxidase